MMKAPRNAPRPAWDYKRRQQRFGLLLVTPALVMIFAFVAYPIGHSLLLTFSDFSLSGTKWFAAGFKHYRRVLGDRAFAQALRFTLSYAVVFVPLSVSFALIVAVLLHQIKVGVAFFRSLLFLPSVIPLTLGYLMFQWVLDPNSGILNKLLANTFGLPQLTHAWLNEQQTVFGTIVAITLWGFGPWIIMLGGLIAIPKDFYEAARIDGANAVAEFWHITLPLMRTTIMIVTVLETIKALKVFPPIYILTQGGPAGQTRSLYYLAWERVQRGVNWYTYASTVGWVFTAIVVVLTLATTFAFRQRKGA